jgi:hypothetical protein
MKFWNDDLPSFNAFLLQILADTIFLNQFLLDLSFWNAMFSISALYHAWELSKLDQNFTNIF